MSRADRYRLTSLYSFDTPGTNPNGLIQAEDGSLYGTTESGGVYVANGSTYSAYGTVFNLSKRVRGFDTNNDGYSDILFRNTGTGDVALWEMNGFDILNFGYVKQGLPLTWQVNAP